MAMAASVLIIDDEPLIHELLVVRLKPEGLKFHHAFRAQEGLATARALQPDLVLLDVIMPDESGFELCSQLKADPATSAIPIIFLTGSTDVVDKVKGFDAGAVDYVTKPFEAAELQARIRAALRSKRYQDMLAQRAQIDGLTGLWNRAYFDQRLREEIVAAQRYGRALGLVMMDLDHFKRMNDTYGHPFGDRVLQTVGELLAEHCRTGDTACRYGGEEFGIIIREADLQQSVRAAERVRLHLEELQLEARQRRVSVTASFGVSTVDRTLDQVPIAQERLLSDADHALYQAKHAGRDRVCVLSLTGPALLTIQAP
jgi:diguanylate cyclase (GGDEF)-like protein